MTDLLSDVMEQSGLDGYGVAAELLQDVREALRNPTNEQVKVLATVAWSAGADRLPGTHGRWEHIVRAVLDALAGQGVGGRP